MEVDGMAPWMTKFLYKQVVPSTFMLVFLGVLSVASGIHGAVKRKTPGIFSPKMGWNIQSPP